MKCIRFSNYGKPEVLKVVECEKPKIADDEVLIKVLYSSVQAADWRIRSMNLPKGMTLMGRLFFGFFKPKKQILGTELSGIIAEIGAKVSHYKVGDEVVAVMGASLGAHAEYVAIKENSLMVIKPKSLSFQEAAVTSFGTLTAYDFLKLKIEIKKDQKILIHGASGPVGLVAVQIVKAMETEVTAVCRTENFNLVTSLGADHCIDYTQDDFRHSPKKWDIILDVTGYLNASNAFRSLNSHGKLILISANLYEILSSLIINLFSSKKVIVGVTTENKQNLQWALHQASCGNLKIIIDREYKMNEVVQAHHYVESRHRKGNVALRIHP